MKNKNAFTIVEVLASVVLLGVLGVIIMPTIQNYIEKMRDDYNKQVEKQLLVSGKAYYTDNKNLLPKLSYNDKKSIGEKKSYVTSLELSTKNYLKKELVDYDGNTCNDSYVLVVRNSSSDDEIWYPCLICGEGEDKKVHSKYPYCSLDANWDDKEEPSCDIEVLASVEGDHINDVYNSNKIAFKFTELSDLPLGNKNYSSIVFYNQATKEFIYEDVSEFEEEKIRGLDLKGIIKNEGVYSIFVMDKGFNKSEACIQNVTIDNTAPTCKVEGAPIDSWVKDATLKVVRTDTSGQLHDTPYSWQKDSDERTADSDSDTYKAVENGDYTAYIKDRAENEGHCSVKIEKIDSIPPSVPDYVSNYADGSGSYTSGDWTYKRVLTTISSSDNESGVDYIKYRKEGSNDWLTFNFGESALTKKDKTWTGTESWDVKNGRNETYYFSACDKVGNCSEESDDYNIRYDTTTPSATITAKKNKAGTTVSSGSWSNEGLNFILTTSTVGASGATIYYCKDTSNTCSPSSEITSGSTITSYNTSNGTYYIRYKIVSDAGISSSVKSYTAKVDTGVPSITITAKKSSAGTSVSEGSWSNQGLNFILKTDSTGTSGATIYYCKDTNNTCSPSTTIASGTTITKYNTATGTYYIRYKVVSGTGTSSTIGSYTAKVDTTAPTITYSANKSAISSKYEAPVVITSKCTDSGGSTISTFTVNKNSVSGASGTNSISKETTISTIGSTSIPTVCKDKAGNSTSETKSYTTFKPVTSVTISSIPSPLWIVVNGDDTSKQTSTAKVTVSPSTATNTEVTWSSSNTSVISISSAGVMTPKAVGNATITATAKDGTGKSVSKKVYVYKAKTRSDADITKATTGGTSSGKITLTSHQVYATNGSGTVTLKVNGKHTTSYGTWLGTGSSATAANCKAFARWICLTDSTASPSGSSNIPFAACDSAKKLVKSRSKSWSNGSAFCDKISLTMSAEGTYYIMLGGGVNVTSCTSCGTSSTKDFSAQGSSSAGVYGDHINAKFTSYSLQISK